MTTQSLRNSMNRSHARPVFLLIPLALAWLALSPTARAQCGLGCSYENTFLGVNALLSNTTGNYNTANGFTALLYNTIGSYNTATGASALYYNAASSNTAT